MTVMIELLEKLLGLVVCGVLLVMQTEWAQAATMPIQNIPVGKVISVNGRQFVKIGNEAGKGAQFVAIAPLTYCEAKGSSGTMQSWTQVSCDGLATPTGTNFTQGPCLTDARDGKMYEIRKFSDGNCWMVDNLMYGGTTDNCAGVDAAGYTNAAYGGAGGAATPSNRFGAGTYGNCRDPRVGCVKGSTYNDECFCTPGSRVCGYFYNYQATIQLPSAYHGVNVSYPHGVPTPSNSYQGICPAGWHVPVGGDGGEFLNLHVAAGSPNVGFWQKNGAWKGVLAGYELGNGTIGFVNTWATYRAANENDINTSYSWTFDGSKVELTYYDDAKNQGFAVRCLKDYSCPANCSACPNSTTCTTCSAGYLKSGSACVLASSVVPNCTNSNGSACTACAAGYALSGGACVPTGSVANCTTYSAPEVCSACSSGRKLMNGKCELDCANPANVVGTMQAFTIAQCSAYAQPTATNYTEIGCLTDTRDGKAYEIRKFADGNCWMADNLAYGGTTDNCVGVDAAGYTNATYGGASGKSTPSNRFGTGTYGNCRDPRVGTGASCAAGSTECGYFYNWQAATQLSTAYYNAVVSYPNGTPSTTNHLQGICPAGWHLPSGGATTAASEFAALDMANGGTGVLQAYCNTAACNFWFPGYGYKEVVSPGHANTDGSILWPGAFYQWSASVNSTIYAYHLALNGAPTVEPGTFYSSKAHGMMVRCVKDKTCPAGCSACSGASCTACASGYTLSGGSCIKIEYSDCGADPYCRFCNQNNWCMECADGISGAYYSEGDACPENVVCPDGWLVYGIDCYPPE